MSDPNEPNPSARRSFLKKASAVVAGGTALSAPLACGLAGFLNPGLRGASGAEWVRVTPLNTLPEDGLPRRFQAVAEGRDAWNRLPASVLGPLFLRRTGPRSVEAFSAICPHAGCVVDLALNRKEFLCPCHNSTFGLDGRVNDLSSPSPRPLDRLEAEIRPEGEVWVQFRYFQPGLRDQVPV